MNKLLTAIAVSTCCLFVPSLALANSTCPNLYSNFCIDEDASSVTGETMDETADCGTTGIPDGYKAHFACEHVPDGTVHETSCPETKKENFACSDGKSGANGSVCCSPNRMGGEEKVPARLLRLPTMVSLPVWSTRY